MIVSSMMYMVVTLFMVSPCLTTDLQWTYQTVEESGKFCPERDSCSAQWRTRRDEELSWESRNCFCDKDCEIYGDCCIDAETFIHSQQKENFHKFSCVEVQLDKDTPGFVYMKSQCSADWPDGYVKTACKENKNNIQDPLGSLPVTSVKTGMTYLNYYCAVCNHDSSSKRFWQPGMNCPTLQSQKSDISLHFLKDNLRFNEGSNHWGVFLTVLKKPIFHVCTFVKPHPPAKLETKLRPCPDPAPHENLIVSCPEEYSDLRVEQLCESYTGLVYSSEDGSIFRNPHCALCNGMDIDNLICIILRGRTILPRFSPRLGFDPVSFAILFDIDETDGEEVGVLVKCPREDVWDPFFRKCRNVVCGKEGEVFEDGKCFQDEAHLGNTSSSSVGPGLSKTTSSSTVKSNVSITTNTSLVKSTKVTTTISTPSTASIATLKPIISVNVMKEILVDEIAALFPVVTTTQPTPQVQTSSQSYRARPSITQALNTSSFRTCPKFVLAPDEFELENDSLYVAAYNLLIPPGKFWLSGPGPSAHICKPSQTMRSGAKFSLVMGYVTTICLGLSIVCLMVHLAVSCIAPPLQNLSGKNLFSLCLAMVGAYTSFLVNMFSGEITKGSCIVLAVLMYYFYMAVFFWTLNIAFDVARTLKGATKDLRLTSGPQWGKFFIYSLVGWLVPAILVLGTVIIDMVEVKEVTESFKPGFGGSTIRLCWFSRKSALVLYFVIPLFIIMVLNILFFISSACLVYSSTRSKAKITTAGPKINFILYLRLSVLMGLSWVAGLVAGWADKEAVWYVFLVFNTLQGLFILVFFTCTKKIVTSVKKRLCGRSRKPEDQTNKSSYSSDSQVYQDTSGSSGRLYKHSTSSYAQYHKYDQRYYN